MCLFWPLVSVRTLNQMCSKIAPHSTTIKVHTQDGDTPPTGTRNMAQMNVVGTRVYSHVTYHHTCSSVPFVSSSPSSLGARVKVFVHVLYSMERGRPVAVLRRFSIFLSLLALKKSLFCKDQKLCYTCCLQRINMIWRSGVSPFG